MKIWKILCIAVVKYIPIILALCVLITIILYFWMEGLFIADLLWGVFYLLQLVAFLILSKTFKFCIYHQLIIYYLLLVFGFLGFDYIVGVPLDTRVFHKLLLALSGITLIAVIITYLKYGDRKISQKDKLTD